MTKDMKAKTEKDKAKNWEDIPKNALIVGNKPFETYVYTIVFLARIHDDIEIISTPKNSGMAERLVKIFAPLGFEEATHLRVEPIEQGDKLRITISKIGAIRV